MHCNTQKHHKHCNALQCITMLFAVFQQPISIWGCPNCLFPICISMPDLQHCSECTYTGPSDSFPLKQSSNGHTKTCHGCHEKIGKKCKGFPVLQGGTSLQIIY